MKASCMKLSVPSDVTTKWCRSDNAVKVSCMNLSVPSDVTALEAAAA